MNYKIAAKNRLYLVSVFLSVIGFIDSCYLLWIKFSQNEALCFVGRGDCITVNNSKFSEWFGIPVAVIGMVGYFVIFLLMIVENRSDFLENNSLLLVFGATLIGVIFSGYLTYIEIAVLQTICPFCAFSALIMLSLFILTIARLVRSQTT
jgi:uncharacterized membrane protein